MKSVAEQKKLFAKYNASFWMIRKRSNNKVAFSTALWTGWPRKSSSVVVASCLLLHSVFSFISYHGKFTAGFQYVYSPANDVVVNKISTVTYNRGNCTLETLGLICLANRCGILALPYQWLVRHENFYFPNHKVRNELQTPSTKSK